MTISFRVPLLPPSVNQCWRKKKGGGFYLTKEAQAFIEAVALLGPKRLVDGWHYDVRLVFRVMRKELFTRDLDNMLKLAIDSLAKANIISDDRYVVALSAQKLDALTRNYEGTEFTVIGLL